MRKNEVKATQEELNKFEMFLFEMDDVLDVFISELAKHGVHLDYSLKSLEGFEQIILENPIGFEKELLVNRAGRYLGEVFRKNIGGKWELCLKHPKYLYLKLPVIVDYCDFDIEFCPTEIIRNLIHRGKPGLLRMVIESSIEDCNINKAKH